MSICLSVCLCSLDLVYVWTNMVLSYIEAPYIYQWKTYHLMEGGYLNPSIRNRPQKKKLHEYPLPLLNHVPLEPRTLGAEPIVKNLKFKWYHTCYFHHIQQKSRVFHQKRQHHELTEALADCCSASKNIEN